MTNNPKGVDRIELAARRSGYANEFRYRTRGQSLFNGVLLAGAHVLEVGCGTGAWSLWAALHGAERVVALEPETDGSTSGTLATLRRSIGMLGLEEKVVASEQFLQDLPRQQRPFDVVVMYDVINHLDEEAVTRLHHDRAAFDRYVAAFQKLHEQMRTGGWLIVADCARNNFWNQLGQKSPFAPPIEWHKHQNPQVWIDVLQSAGFTFSDLAWSPLQPFPRATSNWLVQYLTCSHFVLRVRAS
jgi:cyclopropane fatty-acyl-phospholipid synthase-like methyltransferase